VSQGKIDKAIDEAKIFFDLGFLSDEPRTTPEWILLRELGHVLEEQFNQAMLMQWK